jgi:hypothetical protein
METLNLKLNEEQKNKPCMKENKFKGKLSFLIIWNSRHKLSTTKKSPDSFNALYVCCV